MSRRDGIDRFDLITKLAAVEAIEGAGATDGEREAAAEARARLEARLGESLPRAFAEELEAGHHLREAGVESRTASSGPRPPDRVELGLRLEACRAGRLDAAELARWAARLVDRVVLPDLAADDPESVAPEVLLVLAGGPPSAELVDAMIRFVQSPPAAAATAWAAWLADLARVSE